MRETPLAERIPLWRTLHEDGITVLITPALDYVGGLVLRGLDTQFLKDDEAAQLGEGLRELLAGVEEEVMVHFVYRVLPEVEADLRAYRTGVTETGPAAEALATAKLGWLRQQPLVRSELFVFFSRGDGNGVLDRGVLGERLLFKAIHRLSKEVHASRLKGLVGLRDQLLARLSALGISARELTPPDVQALHYALLNPGRARFGARPDPLELVDNLWSQHLARAEGPHVLEYTEAECLCFESLDEARGHFRQGNRLRRVCTLKVLPESRTRPFLGQALQLLAHPLTGERFGYTLSVSVRIKPQARAKFVLNQQHKLVSALRSVVTHVGGEDARRSVDDADTQGAIVGLFAELNALSSKLCDVSISLLLDGGSMDELEARTEGARQAFRAAGNAELLAEDVAQLPCFLAMLPGGASYPVRRKGCTTRNAADLLPVFQPWGGSQAADSLLTTPLGTLLRFGLFDPSMGNAFHGLMCADTGAGKSLTAGALVLDAFLAGKDAILVDNGGSWARLTRVLGGTHLDVSLNTSICPFLPYREMVERGAPVERLDNGLVQDVVSFLQLCVEDRELPAFSVPEQHLVGTAVTRAYARLRMSPEARPLLGDLQEALRSLSTDEALHPEDRALAGLLVRRLDLFCTGVYARLLNAPSTLRDDCRLLTFEMGAIGKDPLLKRIALAAVMGSVTARAASRRNRTVCAIDEAHDYLGDSPAADAFLGKAYAKMRKFDVAMWAISQKFEDFQRSRAAATIIGNSFLKLFLWHSSGWEVVEKALGWPPNIAEAFRRLERVPFRFTDFLLFYGQQVAVVRHTVPPLHYWLLTTDGEDRRLLERMRERHLELSELELLETLAAKYPHGPARSVRREVA